MTLAICLVHYKAYYYCFFDKEDEFTKKNEELYNPNNKKVLTIINGMPHQYFPADLQAIDTYSGLRKSFKKEHLKVTWDVFLIKKHELSVDTSASSDNTFHGNIRAVEKALFYFKLKKQLNAVMVILHAINLILRCSDPFDNWQPQWGNKKL